MRRLLCIFRHHWYTSNVAGHSNWRTCLRCGRQERQRYDWPPRRQRRANWTIVAVLAAMAILAASCSADTEVASPAADVSEARLWQQYGEDWGHELGTMLGYLWTGSQVKHVDVEHFPDDSKIHVNYWCGGPIVITLTKPHYDPNLSHYNYGQTSVLSSNETNLPGHAYLYDLREELEPAKFNQTDAVTEDQSRSVSVASAMTFNYTVSSETTVSGNLFGASLEEKLSTSLSIGSSTERTRAEAESKSTQTQHEFDIDLEEGKATLIRLTAPDLNTSTPMNAILVPAHGITVDLVGGPCGAYPENDIGPHLLYDWSTPIREDESAAHWARRLSAAYDDTLLLHGPGFLANAANLDWKCGGDIYGGWKLPCSLSFESKDRLNQMLNGTHERWQGVNRYGTTWRKLSCSNHRWVHGAPSCYYAYRGATEDPGAWAIHLAATQHRTYEAAVKEVVMLVSGGDLDKLLADDTIEKCDPGSRTC